MERRAFLRAGMAVTAAGSGVLAGCASLFDVQYGRLPPIPENRPSAVYYPSHIEGMDMIGMNGASGTGSMAGMSDMGSMENMSGTNGSSEMQENRSDSMTHMHGSVGGQMTRKFGSVCALMYSYPERFWTVTGDRTEKVTIQEDDSVHLMVSVWDEKTGTYVMDTAPTVTVSQGDETVTTRSLWTMLSQNMGFHAGDNISLPGNGTYSVTVEVPPTAARRTGAFEGRFATRQSFEFEFEYSKQRRNEITFKLLEEKAGERGAVDPMNTKMMALSFAPKKRELPGRRLGTKTSGDAEFVVTAIENTSRFGAAGKTYLAVSPRTPYNRYILPAMSLSARVVRGGNTIFDGALTATLDSALGYHYGNTVESIESGDTIELGIDAPPQVSRHEGYETAFLDMPSRTITVE